MDWGEVETSDNVFDWSVVDSRITTILNANLEAGLEFLVGKDCPAWLQSSAGTFTTTLDTYPRYYNPVYKTRYHRFLRKVIEHLSVRGDVKFYQVTEGTTGDEGAWHGTLTSGFGDPYVPQTANGADWQDFRYEAWDSVKNDIAKYPLTYTHLLFNTGNNAQNVDLIASKVYGDAWGKKGDPAHNYQFNSPALYASRAYVVSRGEVQDEILTSAHKNKDAYALMASALKLQLDIMNTPPGFYTSLVGSDRRFTAMFNKYANDTVSQTSTKAFIKLGTLISIDSTGYWDETTYGKLIPTGSTTAYNAAIASINSSSDGPAYKAYRRMVTTINYANPTRVNNLKTLTGTTALYDYGTQVDYDNDFVYSATQNWGKFITEVNSKANSFPLYRVAPDTAMYGRFAKQFTGTNLMSFDIADNWFYGAASGLVTFSITYQNTGTDTWGVQVYNSAGALTTVATQTNTNTTKWLTKTFTADVQFRAGEDFRLIHTSGTNNVIFDLIELSVTSSAP